VNKKTFIGVGSNMGDSQGNCVAAMRNICSGDGVTFLGLSSLYRTSPVSEHEQDDFINCALSIIWTSSPEGLLAFLGRIEMSMGRKRDVKWGPRLIDLDILLFGDLIQDSLLLTIPHPELHRRKFALIPCLEIDPYIVHPRFGRPLKEFVGAISEDQQIRLVKDAADVLHSIQTGDTK
jgi:2-amino-4-hydroxy-6-hydroxymethyldihydropteridine diphosphokinase